MANLRVFVSSTAYDLAVLRSSLRQFIGQLGFEPVLSEYSAVLYDPREHTHISCLTEVRGCDMMVLVVGSRFGGEVIPEVLVEVAGSDYERLLAGNDGHKLSVTQAEVLTALSHGIPVFSFVDTAVLHDYRVYQLNKGADIRYPSIEQEGTAEFIFNFIDFLQARSYNNAMQPFARLEDVHGHLQKQWAGLFQRLLRQDREQLEENRRIDRLTEQFDDLKTALLTTVGDKESRTIARAAVRYRRLMDLLRQLPGRHSVRDAVINFEGDWAGLLREVAGVVRLESVTLSDSARPGRTVLVLEDGGGLFSTWPYALWHRRGSEWEEFRAEDRSVREVVFDELAVSGDRGASVMLRPITAEEVHYLLSENVDEFRYVRRGADRDAVPPEGETE